MTGTVDEACADVEEPEGWVDLQEEIKIEDRKEMMENCSFMNIPFQSLLPFLNYLKYLAIAILLVILVWGVYKGIVSLTANWELDKVELYAPADASVESRGK